MKHIARTASFTLMLLSILTLNSCQSGKGNTAAGHASGIADSTVIHLYMLAPTGHYAEHVAAMQSCDGTTQAYKDQTMLALKQHQDYIRKEKKGVKQATVERIECNTQGTMANAFLNVTYNDGSQEEVMFPIVRDSIGWRIQ